MTGLKWQFRGSKEPTYLLDTRLPIGSNKGPSHFHRLSRAVRRCMARRGMAGVVAYIDDFLLVAKSKEDCQNMLMCLINLH